MFIFRIVEPPPGTSLFGSAILLVLFAIGASFEASIALVASTDIEVTDDGIVLHLAYQRRVYVSNRELQSAKIKEFVNKRTYSSRTRGKVAVAVFVDHLPIFHLMAGIGYGLGFSRVIVVTSDHNNYLELLNTLQARNEVQNDRQ